MLNHEQIQERGLVEAYVRRRLAPDECAAFEEHYFQCGNCFDEVKLVEKFVAGVGHAARTGLLDRERETRTWLPAFAFAAAMALVLAAVLTFVVFIRQPAQEARLQQQLQQALSQTHSTLARIAQLDQRAALDAGPEANVPVVILIANRSGDSPNLVQLDSQSRRTVLWIDVPAQPPGTRFGVTITTPDPPFSKSIHGLERNSSGALAASLPSADLPAGTCNIRLFNEKSPGQRIAEYRLRVERR